MGSDLGGDKGSRWTGPRIWGPETRPLLQDRGSDLPRFISFDSPIPFSVGLFKLEHCDFLKNIFVFILSELYFFASFLKKMKSFKNLSIKIPYAYTEIEKKKFKCKEKVCINSHF